MKCPLIAAFLFSLSAFADGGEGRVIHHDGGSLVFNSSGVLTIAANDVAVSRFVYDGDRRVTAADMLFGTNYFAFAFLRDAGGLVTNLVCGESLCVTKSYDLRGRLTSLRDGYGHEWTFRYDAENRLVGGASPDGVNRSLAYDGCGRVTEWSVGSLAGRTITRDAAGRRIRDDVTAGPMPIPSSNRLAENVFDESDRLVSASVKGGGVTFFESYLYDGNGALTNILADGASVFNAFYSAGRLVSLGTNGWHCAYDALGNRVRICDRIFVPDYDDPLKRPLLECDTSGAVIRRYLWGPTGLLGFIDANDELTVAHSDEQGSVIALTDVDGNVLFRANYGPYGEDWGSSGANPTPFFWLGGLGVMKADPSSLIPHPSSLIPSPSSLYLTRHRLYSPVLRRFLSADPLGFAGGANVYAYADGNPLAYVDPLGLCADDFDTLVRIGGFFQMLGGASEAAAGYAFAVGTAETGVGIAAGVAVGLHGTDVAYAGYRTMMDGASYDSLTSRGLQAVGVPQGWANGIDVGVSVAGSAGVGLAARGASQSTTLYRAVKQPELSDIQLCGRFRIPETYAGISAEGKYFTTSQEAAETYARAAMGAFKSDPPYSIIKTVVPNSSLPVPVSIEYGIPAYVMPERTLDSLRPIILNTIQR